MDKDVEILGVRVDNLSRDDTESWLENVLNNPPQQKFIVTLNPEIVLNGYYDKSFQNILNSADLALCDGFGIKLMGWIKGKKIESRYTGVELVNFLLKLAKKKDKQVLVVVWKNSLSSPKEIERGIESKFGLEVQAKYFEENNFFEIEKTKKSEVILVNFGAPDQERFISEYRGKFPNAKILIGVGGAFDFLTGKIKRAPSWMQKFGLEWLWRLIQEPKRLRRIWKAVVVFPTLSLFREK